MNNDIEVLDNTAATLSSTNDPQVQLSTLSFATNVLCQDFLPEIFLQRSRFIKVLISYLIQVVCALLIIGIILLNYNSIFEL